MKLAPFESTPGIEWKNGCWRYRPTTAEKEYYQNKYWVKIGKNIHEVYDFLSEKSKRGAGVTVHIRTVGNALTKYEAEIVPLKAKATRRINGFSIERLRLAFGDSPIRSIEFEDAEDYRDAVGLKNGKKSANNDLEVLSHLYSCLIRWRLIKNNEHPFRGNRGLKFALASRDRYVTHDEIKEALTIANSFFKIYIPIKIKTGLDKSTILRIKVTDLTDEGILYRRGKLDKYNSVKKPKWKIIPWDDELRFLIDKAMSLHRKTNSTNLFSNRKGEPYINDDGECEGFNSVWQRFMKKVLEDTKVSERFTEHDLRAKNASDEEDEEMASRRLNHSDKKITNEVYRRKPESIVSLQLKGIGLESLLQIEDLATDNSEEGPTGQ